MFTSIGPAGTHKVRGETHRHDVYQGVDGARVLEIARRRDRPGDRSYATQPASCPSLYDNFFPFFFYDLQIFIFDQIMGTKAYCSGAGLSDAFSRLPGLELRNSSSSSINNTK